MSKKQATYDDALYWTVDDVGEWLQQVGFYEFVEPLHKCNINGKGLFELSERRLQGLYPNMPTGKSDPASMLFKQINKVKESRRTGKKSMLSFGWGSERKPPKAPVPDYRQPQTNRQESRDGHGSEEEGWGSDFSEEEESPEFDRSEDVHPSQGHSQGRAPSYNGSSTSSFTNLSSSASVKDDDSSMLYEAPNQGDCDEIYDFPHEDEEEDNRNSLQPGRPPHNIPGRASPLPPVSPRHERPLPTLPPSQHSWQQPPPPQQGHRLAPHTPQRPSQSPHHFQRQSDIPIKQEEEQEEYEVPCIAELNQPNYEAPIMDTQEEEEIPEEEYLVPVADGTNFKPQRPHFGRPPAPLPPTPGSGSGMPPPRPVKPPELAVTPTRPPSVPDEGPPPPIPTRPIAPRTPIESKGFSKVLPDPPPHVIREVLNRPPEIPRDKSPIRTGPHMSNGNAWQDENRNFVPRKKTSAGSAPKLPPPLPKTLPRDAERAPEVSENSGSGSGTIGRRLQQFQGAAEDTESMRPPPLPRPLGNKPELSAKPNTNKPVQSWLNTAIAEANNQAANVPSLPHTPASSSAHAPPRPTPRSRLPAEPPTSPEHKPTPPIPTKEPAKPIKKFTPHSSRVPDLPKQIPAEAPPAPPPDPRTMPQPPTRNEMTGFPWYDADLSRDEAVQILKQAKMDGAFVVRNSTKGGDNIPYSLSLWFNNKVRNLHIRLRDDGKYALGTYKDNEQVFDTAVLLIQHHMTSPLILAGDAGKTCLKVAAPNFR
ncbi:extensin-like isoform X2 [Patiria miniata]|uniref:SH2 domain-containing protein n=1 Tax=Patiria miniata TaxID=46514 RepID=A0A914B2K1_PATMI|nr:extensin-like isoform X2 [Patiria miniata]